MNTPNKLTVFRMIIAPVFLAVYLLSSIPHNMIYALAIFIVASLTDMIDGKLARSRNQVTIFGKLADPVADKMLTTAALLAFMQDGICNIWIVMIILTREFAVTSVRLVASAQGVVIAANIWGKIKTASQMVFTILIMLILILKDFAIIPDSFNIPLVSNILLAVTAVLTAVSGVIYLIEASKTINITM